MRFILEKKHFPLTKTQKIGLCLILNMQIKTEKIVYSLDIKKN